MQIDVELEQWVNIGGCRVGNYPGTLTEEGSVSFEETEHPFRGSYGVLLQVNYKSGILRAVDVQGEDQPFIYKGLSRGGAGRKELRSNVVFRSGGCVSTVFQVGASREAGLVLVDRQTSVTVLNNNFSDDALIYELVKILTYGSAVRLISESFNDNGVFIYHSLARINVVVVRVSHRVGTRSNLRGENPGVLSVRRSHSQLGRNHRGAKFESRNSACDVVTWGSQSEVLCNYPNKCPGSFGERNY